MGPLSGICLIVPPVIVPLLVPDAPEVITAHVWFEIAVQFIVPAPAFTTEKVVVPDELDTERSTGVTDKMGCRTPKVAVWDIGAFIVTDGVIVVPL